MTPPDCNVAETKSLLLSMVAEANDFKKAAGGSVTDAVAGWLAPQFLLAARKKLETTDETSSFEVLTRTFVRDWAMLRHGDHTAERLRIERERLKLAKRDAKQKWQTKSEAGVEQIMDELKNNSEARVLFKKVMELLRGDSQVRKEKEFRDWIKRPDIRKEILPELARGLSPETLKRIEEELRLL